MSALQIPAELVCTLCPHPKRFGDAVRFDGHMRWAHPLAVGTGGERCDPPPVKRDPHVPLWKARLVELDEAPGVWMRWEFQGSSGAYSTATKMRVRSDAARYRFEVHKVDERWWMYGIHLDNPEEPGDRPGT